MLRLPVVSQPQSNSASLITFAGAHLYTWIARERKHYILIVPGQETNRTSRDPEWSALTTMPPCLPKSTVGAKRFVGFAQTFPACQTDGGMAVNDDRLA